MLYLVPQSVVLAVIFCYHLFSLGRLFVKSKKNVGFALGMINNTYSYRGECLHPTNRSIVVNTAIPSSISNFLYVYLFTCMFNYLL